MIGSIEIALPEMERNFVKRALLPLFGFREPEHLALGIKARALSAKIFLAANFNQLVHELHSCVKPTAGRTIAESEAESPLHFVALKEATFLPFVDIAMQMSVPSQPTFWHTKCRCTASLACAKRS
jgi:hypothetical protein